MRRGLATAAPTLCDRAAAFYRGRDSDFLAKLYSESCPSLAKATTFREKPDVEALLNFACVRFADGNRRPSVKVFVRAISVETSSG
jgi:hypothetical protein